VASSDKGVIASHVLEILGGPENIWLISGEALYQLLYDLATVSQSEEFRRRLIKIAEAANIRTEPGDIDEFTRQVLQALTSEHHERVWTQASKLHQSLGLNSRYSD